LVQLRPGPRARSEKLLVLMLMLLWLLFPNLGCCGPPASMWHDDGPGALKNHAEVEEPVFEGERFAIRFPDMLPTSHARQLRGASASTHPEEGDWVLQRMSVGPELGEFPFAAKMKGREVRLKIEAVGEHSFRLFVKVANTLRAQAIAREDDTLKPFEGLKLGPVMSTRMMGPESMMQVEKQLSDALEELQKWMVAGGELLLAGPAAELSFARAGDDGSLPANEVHLL